MLKRKPKPAKPAPEPAASETAVKTATQTVSQAVSQEYRKPRADIYTVLLVVALAMLLVATAALWMVMKEYDNMIKGGPPSPVWNRPAAGATFDAPRAVA